MCAASADQVGCTMPSSGRQRKEPGLCIVHTKAAPRGGGGLPGCRPLKPTIRNLKNTDFVDIMISRVLQDFHFSQNQPLKSADDEYITILKNKLTHLKKQEDRTLSRGTYSI
jgi:hypothetical protein